GINPHQHRVICHLARPRNFTSVHLPVSIRDTRSLRQPSARVVGRGVLQSPSKGACSVGSGTYCRPAELLACSSSSSIHSRLSFGGRLPLNTNCSGIDSCSQI